VKHASPLSGGQLRFCERVFALTAIVSRIPHA